MLKEFFRRLILLASLSFGASALAQTTVTLQDALNGYGGTTDNWIVAFSGANTNKGGDVNIGIRGTSDYGLYRFAIFAAEGGPVPNGATITSATLSLYKAYGPDGVMRAQRLTKPWTELGSTWNSTGAENWSTPGGDVVSTADGEGSAPDSAANSCADGIGHEICWLNINVTAGVQAFASGASQNYGWRVSQVSSSDPFNYKNFNSRNNNNFPQYRPKLTITYAIATPGTSVTLRDGLNNYGGTTDNWIVAFSGANTNRGGDVNVGIRGTSDYGLYRFFPIFAADGGPVPDGATINSATLSLYKAYGPDGVMRAQRLTKPWTEMGSTWNSTGTENWSTPGGDVVPTADGEGSVPDSAANNCADGIGHEICWLNIDVTAGVQAFASGASQNHGWRVSQVSSSDPFNYKNFNSRNNNNFPQYRPKLTINYSGTGCTPPTANLAASPTTGPAPLNVTLNASASADGSSPITSLRLQFSDGTPDVTWSNKATPQQHTFNLPNGQKTATLTATSACGTSAPVSRTINVGGTPPTASFTATPSAGAAPLVVTFDASASTPGSGTISELRLQFDDGSSDIVWTDKSQTRQKTFNLPNGAKVVTLTASNEFGTSAPVTRTVTVGDIQACIPSDKTGSGAAVPTFHSMGLYYNPGTAPTNGKVFMRYRKGSDDPNVASSWKPGHELWYDSRNVHNYRARGSAVHLDPGTPYVFEVGPDGVNWDASIQGLGGEPCPATWTETASLPISPTPGPTWSGVKTSTTNSNYPFGYKGSARSRTHVLLANQSGSASGYTLYDFTGLSAVAQSVNQTDRYAVVISGHHMIIRGLEIVGGASGIFIDPGSTDIVIENSVIRGYGRQSPNALGAGLTGNRAINEDAGIYFPSGDYGIQFLETKRIVIQRNTMRNPAHGSNPWDGSNHPDGTAPITMYPTGGQIVVRYNTTYSTTNGQLDGPPDLNHFHADGLILGGCNESSEPYCAGRMGIGADVDIYKNLVMHYFDDGLETDGESTNVRIWKNYFDYGGASAVSTTPTHVGPAYMWRNVYNRAREWITEPWGNEAHGRDSMMKAGGIGFNGGRRYIYHNTSLQAPWESEPDGEGPNPLGTGLSVKGTGGTSNGLQNTVTRNNVFQNWKAHWAAFDLTNATSNNNFDYDLTNSNCWSGSGTTCSTTATEPHGYVVTAPGYLGGNGWVSSAPGWHGKYRLNPTVGNKGYNDGEPIANFNDGTTANRPDRGAHQNGTPDMDFGTTAAGH